MMKHHPFEYFEFVECLECEGTGIIQYQETQGGVNAGGPWVDIIGHEEVCDICDGEGQIENTCWDDTIEGNPSGRLLKFNAHTEERK